MEAPPISHELQRRQKASSVTWTLFQRKPQVWLHWRRFAQFSPCAWRSRISDARKEAVKAGGRIEWNHSVTRSAYRYVPAASEPSPEQWTIPGAPWGPEPFELTP